jgi:hypothetical protein
MLSAILDNAGKIVVGGLVLALLLEPAYLVSVLSVRWIRKRIKRYGNKSKTRKK